MIRRSFLKWNKKPTQIHFLTADIAQYIGGCKERHVSSPSLHPRTNFWFWFKLPPWGNPGSAANPVFISLTLAVLGLSCCFECFRSHSISKAANGNILYFIILPIVTYCVTSCEIQRQTEMKQKLLSPPCHKLLTSVSHMSWKGSNNIYASPPSSRDCFWQSRNKENKLCGTWCWQAF